METIIEDTNTKSNNNPNFQNSNFITNIILSQEINCKNKSLGCEWNGQICKYLEYHLECPKDFIKCPNFKCKEYFYREKISDHLQECFYREIKCEKCYNKIKFIEIESHKYNCPKENVKCPNDCGEFFLRELIEDHIMNSCINLKITCEYRELGCDISVKKKDYNEHLKDFIDFHCQISIEFMKKYIKEVTLNLNKIEDFIQKNIKDNFQNQFDYGEIRNYLMDFFNEFDNRNKRLYNLIKEKQLNEI